MAKQPAIAPLYQCVCEERSVTPDLQLLRDLQQRSDTLHLTSEPHIALLLHLLTTTAPSTPESQYGPSHLSITAPSLSSATVGTLATYLTHQKHMTHLNITHTAMPETAVETLLTALTSVRAHGSPLTHLACIDVGLTACAAEAVARLLELPLGRLSHVDLSNNSVNWRGVRALSEAGKARGPKLSPLTIETSGNLVVVETLNTLTHGVGALVALVAGTTLTMQARRRHLSSGMVGSVAIFCASLFILMASSTAYHGVFRHARLHRLLRRADHCSIFLLIAGTYTPFIVAYTFDTLVGRFSLGTVWLCALVGVVQSLAGSASNRSRALFALLTGWIGMFAVRTMIARMQREAFLGVLAGGVAYSFGIIFYLLGKKVPMMHVIWHLSVLVGGTFHYVALAKYVVLASPSILP